MKPIAIYKVLNGFDTIVGNEVTTLDQADTLFEIWNKVHSVAAWWLIDDYGNRISPMRVNAPVLQRIWDSIVQISDENEMLTKGVSFAHPKGTKLVAVQHFFEDIIGDSWMEDIMKGEWR